MVDVATEQDDRLRRTTTLARADRADKLHETVKGIAECRPVLEVERPTRALPETTHHSPPGACADGFVPGFQVVLSRRQEQRKRVRQE